MIKLLLGLFIFTTLIFLFGWIRTAIIKNSFKTFDKALTNSSIGNVYDKNGREVFSWKKFRNGMFNLFSSVEWAKSLKEMFDLRKLTVFLLIASSIFAFAWYQGRMGAPVKVDLGHGKEAYIRLNGDFLHIDKNGYIFIEDKFGNKKKQIALKDIPNLKKKLAPIGLEFTPIAVVGAGMGTSGEGAIEAGAGVSFFRFWRWRLETFITSYPAIYLGTSYKLDGVGLKNSRVGVGVGKGFKDWKFDQSDTRAIIYFAVEF